MMPKKRAASKAIVVKTAGYSITDRLTVDVGPAQCGGIGDGVAFWHDQQGAWVLSFSDLERIYEAAVARRAA